MQNDTKPSIPSVRSAAVPAEVRLDVLRDYVELTKPEITLLVVLSSVGGFVLAPVHPFDVSAFVFLLIGVMLTSAGASALNHWMERDFDGAMRRTMNRPLPEDRIGAEAARNFGALLLAAGVALLCPLTNPLTGVLALVSALLYLFVYTPLKRRSKWNTLIGTLPGALPALGGWTAATGSVGWGGIAAFSILAAWQMPHFLSLAWMYRKDYERGGHMMLPVTDPSGRSTVNQTLFFTVALAVLSLWPTALALTGWIYTAAAVGLAAWFLHAALVFYRSYHVHDARRVLKVSIYYIPLLVLALLVDRIVGGGLLTL
ncbi:MAG: heme o synthase [Rhodothermales bacterium]